MSNHRVFRINSLTAISAIGAWGMKDGSLVIKVYEIEMLEEDTLTLTPEEDGVQVKLVNTTISSQPNEYISTEIQ